MHDLPPMNGVKAFEAAARTGSFTSAAAELRVSSAAISQQVRNLETYFGRQLFVRHGNRITLTDAGQSVFPRTTRALGDLSSVSVFLRENTHRSRLVISAPYSLAELWIAPKLACLVELLPNTPIDFRAEEDPVDFLKYEIDIRISYGDYHYPRMTAVPVVNDAALAVCAPEFWRRHRLETSRLAEVSDDKFIHLDWGPNYASHPTWANWFAAAGLSRSPDPERGHRMGLSSLAISAARHGVGIALGQRTMARVDLEANRLIALSSVMVPLGHPYVAFVPQPKAERPLVKTLLDLLKE